MSTRRTSAKASKLVCPRCMVKFSVTAFLMKCVDRAGYWKSRAQEHDCAGHVKALEARRNAKVNPMKAAKASMKGKK